MASIEEVYDMIRENKIGDLVRILSTIDMNDSQTFLDYEILRLAFLVKNLQLIRMALRRGCRAQLPGISEFYQSTLYYAIIHNDPVFVKVVLSRGMYMENYRCVYDTPYTLASTSCAEISKMILESYIDQCYCPANVAGYTPLHVACTLGYTDYATKFLDMGADVNARLNYLAKTSQGSTPLHLAVQQRNAELALLLLDRGAAVSVKNADDRSVFYLTVQQWPEMIDRVWEQYVRQHDNAIETEEAFALLHRSVFKTIYRRCKKPDDEFPINWRCSTGLHYAVAMKNVSLAETLIHNGASVDALDDQSFTPLHLACKLFPEAYLYGSVMWFELDDNDSQIKVDFDGYDLSPKNVYEIVRLIAKQSNTINARDDYGNTALFYACDNIVVLSTLNDYTNADMDYVKDAIYLLLSLGADVTIANNSGETALHRMLSEEFRADQQSAFKIIQELIQRGADLDAVDDQGATPLMNAIQIGCEKTVKFLLESNAPITGATDKQPMPLLHMAAELPNPPVTEDILFALLKYGADPNEPAPNGKRPIHCLVNVEHAVNTSSYSFVDQGDKRIKVLVEQGGDVNGVDAHGKTALFYTAVNFNGPAAFELFKSDADVNILDNMEHSFLGYVDYKSLESVAENTQLCYTLFYYFILVRQQICKLEEAAIGVDRVILYEYLDLEYFCLKKFWPPHLYQFTLHCEKVFADTSNVQQDTDTSMHFPPRQVISYYNNFMFSKIAVPKFAAQLAFPMYPNILALQYWNTYKHFMEKAINADNSESSD